MAVGGLTGAAVGAAAGALLARGERWQVVSASELAVSVEPLRARAVGVTVALRF